MVVNLSNLLSARNVRFHVIQTLRERLEQFPCLKGIKGIHWFYDKLSF